MTVIFHEGRWLVIGSDGSDLSNHATNEDAWRWIERQSGDDGSPAAHRQHWSFVQCL